MQLTTDPEQTMQHYSVFAAGTWDELGQHKVQLGERKVRGKVFMSDRVDSTGSEVSLNRIPSGRSVPFLHRHKKHEEIYIVVRGAGDFYVDGDVVPVTEGCVVRIAPEGVRAFRAGNDGPMDVICIQAVAGTLRNRTVTDGEIVADTFDWPQ